MLSRIIFWAFVLACAVAWTFVLRWLDARAARKEAALLPPGPPGARPCSLCTRLTARVTEDGTRVCKACAARPRWPP
jgi:hypothetical protein